jgi:hypothetical protein
MNETDFTKPPVRRGPRERLAPTIERARERRAAAPIETISVTRVDVNYRNSVGLRTIVISLPRMKFLERPER